MQLVVSLNFSRQSAIAGYFFEALYAHQFWLKETSEVGVS